MAKGAVEGIGMMAYCRASDPCDNKKQLLLDRPNYNFVSLFSADGDQLHIR